MKVVKLLFCAALAVSLCSVCLADDLGIQGTLQVGANYLDFINAKGVPVPAPGDGAFQVANVLAGSVFATGGVTTGELGSIQSLDQSPGPIALPFAFLTFSGPGGSSLPLTATNIPAGTVGPYNLSDTSRGAEATFEVLGYVGSNTAETFTAEFNVYYPGYTVAQLFNQLPLEEQFCANIDVGGTPTLCNVTTLQTTPEPNYIWFVAASLLVAGFLGQRRIASKRI